MKIKKLSLVALGLASLGALSGCMSMGVGYVQPKPDLFGYDKHIDQPLVVVLGERVADEFVVETTGIKSLNVKEYRKSLGEGLQAAFGQVFSSVTLADQAPSEGMAVVVVRSEPKHVKAAAIVEGVGDGSTYTNYEIRVKTRYQAELWKDGAKVSSVTGEATSEESAANIFGLDAVFRNGIEKASEDMVRRVLSDDPVAAAP